MRNSGATGSALIRAIDSRKVAATSLFVGLLKPIWLSLICTKLRLPAALGIFSGQGDFSRDGDSQSLYALNGFSGHLDPPKPKTQGGGEYAGNTNLQDPVLSPVFADLHGMPPTLFITSTRDLLLSGTTTLHRAFLNAGVDARLIVFDGLAHAFWNDLSLPETKEAHQDMAHFFDQELGK